jgi:transcriptional pleiotropic regulator of transition state genes
MEYYLITCQCGFKIFLHVQPDEEVLSMKSTGVVRKIDELGRIVIPIELRRTMGIDDKDSLEILIEGEKIVLQKYSPGCIFCGDVSEVRYYKGKYICKNCFTEIWQQSSS